MDVELERYLPRPSFFLPEPVKDALFRKRVGDAVRAGRPVLHFTHAHCLDGAACDALVRLHHGLADVETVFLEPHETVPALDVLRATGSAGGRLVVSDLSFQKGEGARVLALLEGLARAGWTVTWRDHHHKQWEGAPVDAMNRVADVTVDATGTECGATLVQKALLPQDAFAQELAAVVRDHDLYLLKDPRSLRLQQAIAHVGSRHFVDHVVHSRHVLDDMMSAWSRREAARKDALVQDGVRDAWFKIGREAVIGVTYGRVPTNDVLHTLYGDKGAHLAILVKPEGTFSLRSRDDVPVCHRIAQAFGGGGHPNASGGKLDLPAATWPVYWLSRGRRGAEALVDRAVEEVDAFLADGARDAADPGDRQD